MVTSIRQEFELFWEAIKLEGIISKFETAESFKFSEDRYNIDEGEGINFLFCVSGDLKNGFSNRIYFWFRIIVHEDGNLQATCMGVLSHSLTDKAFLNGRKFLNDISVDGRPQSLGMPASYQKLPQHKTHTFYSGIVDLDDLTDFKESLGEVVLDFLIQAKTFMKPKVDATLQHIKSLAEGKKSKGIGNSLTTNGRAKFFNVLNT